MATIKFLLQSKSSKAQIYLRLSLGKGLVFKRRTGIIIDPRDWSINNGFPFQNTAINKNITVDLKSLELFIIKQINENGNRSYMLDGDWLQKTIDEYFNRTKVEADKLLVTYWIKDIINNAHLRENGKGGYGLSISRVNAYKGLLKSIKEYQKHKELKIIELNKSKFDDFKKWLFDIKKYNPTTAIKKLTDLQKIIREAEENGITIAKDFNKVKFKKVSAYDDDMDVISLTFDDLEKIEKADIQAKSLINARKWLMLACYTGQRGNDLVNKIIKENFKSYGEHLVIRFKQGKGNKTVSIPVLPKVKEIYYEGLPYHVSVQKLNKHFKTICKLAEIDNLVLGKIMDKKTRRRVKKWLPKYRFISSHTGRRSFASNHYGKLPTPIIMRVTGHLKESTFLGYLQKNHEDHIDFFLDYYKTQELKERKESRLEVVEKYESKVKTA